ncbi:MAG: 50S ribosomal protein L25 [Deltaproteobacteria bacterium]|jgi:large subunit ribosomal protein L25|nr:50S ribosomal protein L25 [Deltaproteobacteria bacterium]
MGLDTVINARPRQAGGSNEARRLRLSGALPAVFYGKGSETLSLELRYADFKKAFLNDSGNRSLFSLSVEGEGTFPILVKDYQTHPVTRKMLHVDFLKIDPQSPIEVKVPVILVGKAVGVERGGQILQSEREIVVRGLPADIPAQIEADVSALNLGQTMHISQIKLPETLTLAQTVDLPLAVVAIPKGAKADAESEAAAAAAPVAVPAGKPEKKPEKKTEKRR